MAVAGDLIFFSQNSNGDDPPYRLKALSRRTGALVWQQTFTAAISPPVWHEGLVYICKYQDGVDQLIAFQGSDGRESWYSTITAPPDFGTTTPAISSLGAFMLHSRESDLSSLWGFDLDTQTSRFSTDLPEFLNTASPSIHDGHVYSYLGENLRQHSPQTGEVLWTLPLPGGQYNSPTRNVCLQGNKAWLTAADADSSRLVCVNLSPPSLSWVKPGVYYGNPVISNGIVYVASSQKVSAFFSGTGAWLADYPTQNFTVSSLMVSHDQLIVFCYGKVFFFSLQDHQLLSTLPFGSSNEVSGAAVEGELILAEEGIAGFIRLFVHADPTNQPPIAQAQTVETMEDEEVTLQLTGTDGDVDTLSYAVRTLPVKGTLYQTADGVIKGAAITTLPAHVWDPQGRLIYVPAPDSFGQGIGSFTFTSHDDVSASSAATVTISVNAWPVPRINPAGGTFDQPVAVTVGKVEPDTYIYYTLDGSAPNLDSRSFASGSTVTLDASAQLRVISVKGSDVSSIQQATFTLPDSDNDGLPDWWEMQHFGLVTAASEETDNDLDGMSDLEEFLTGTDPRAAADSFIGRVMFDDGTVTLTWSSKAGRIYTIETSPDLVHWTPATAEIRGTGSPLQHTLNSGGESRAFSRIRALRDLAVP